MRRPILRDRTFVAACVLAAVFLLAHLPFLASTLEDIDSINFALGVRDFDPGQHRPHPPGYPIYIALAKTARLVLSEPHALAVWAALFGALAVFPLLRVFQCVDTLGPADGGRGGAARAAWITPAWMAALVTATAPLYWMTALRPLSDVVGLAAAATAQALLATALVRQFRDQPDTRGQYDPGIAARSGRLILFGALAAGLAIGVRSQAAWLTVPLLVGVIVARIGRGAAGAMIGASIWFVGGVLAWLVPLVVASGGPAAYLSALQAQATEDWVRVDLLVTNPGIRRLAFGLHDTFILHWAGLGWLVAALAILGAVVMLWRSRAAFVLLLVTFAPYGIFHVFFQESFTTRYALPLVPLMAYLAVRGAWALGRVPAIAMLSASVLVSLWTVIPVAAEYTALGSPVSRALADVRAEATRVGRVTLGRHVVYNRAIQAGLDTAGITVLTAPPASAWAEQAQHLLDDDRTPLWLLGIPRRTHLALADPAARIVRGEYRWPFPSATFLGGERPSGVDWIEVRRPGWLVVEGWHLTPETAGQAVAAGKGLGAGPITAYVRARPGPARMMIGGRHLGAAGDPDIAFTVRLDGREIDAWTASPASQFFLRFTDLPAGALAGSGRWLHLTVEARRTDNGQYAAQGAIEQFNLQNDAVPMVGFDKGWHELELNTPTGMLWRWTSERADLRIQPVGRDVVLEVTGESPMRSFVRPSRVVVRAGGREFMRTGVAADFAWSIDVPAAVLAASGGVVTIETDQVFRPADRRENADRRPLGLRILSVAVRPAS